ncbi:MAG: hypothetical protein HY717_00480 [Planctomycetes bacterium]|nr:hypothetical protein [Planctomycetota bacterium]
MDMKWNGMFVILIIALATGAAARAEMLLHLDAAAPGPNPSIEWQDLSGKNGPFSMVGPGSVAYDDPGDAYTFSGARGVTEGLFQSAGADEANFDFEGLPGSAAPFMVVVYFRLNESSSQPFAFLSKSQSSQQGWMVVPFTDDGFDRFDVVGQGGGGDRWYYRDQTNPNTKWGDGTDWHLAVVAVDGSGHAGGVAVYLDGSATPLGNTVIIQDDLASSMLNDEPLRVGGSLRGDGTFRTCDGSIGFIEIWSGNAPEGMIPAAYSQFRWNNGAPTRAGITPTNNPPRAVAASVPSRVALRNGAAEVTLDGSASHDGDGGTQGLAYSWEKVSGPGGDAIVAAAQAVTKVTFTQFGEYIYRLTVDDRQAANNTASAEVQVVVLPEVPNPIPDLLLHLDAAAPGPEPSLEWQDLSGKNLPFRMAGPGSVAYDDGGDAYAFSGVRGVTDGFFQSAISDEANFDFEGLPGSAVPFTAVAYFRLNNTSDQTLALLGKLQPSQQGWFVAPFEGDGFDHFDVVGQGGGGDRWYYRDRTDPNTKWGDGTDWHLAVVAVDGSGHAGGVAVYLDGSATPLANTAIVQDDLASSTLNDEPMRVGGLPRFDGTFKTFDGSIGFIEIWSGNSPKGLTPAEYSKARWNNGDPFRAGEVTVQLPGDCNQDGHRDITDVICLIRLQFASFFLLDRTRPDAPCASDSLTDPGNKAILDVNGDGRIDISDIVYLASFLFLGSNPPVQGAGCIQVDPALGCPNNPACE